MLDSAPPITALLAAEALGADPLALLAGLQQAHYVDGQRIAERGTLTAVAAAMGLDAAQFEARFDALSGAATDAHMAESRALLARLGGQGYPSFALETAEGFSLLEVSPYIGHPDAWRRRLSQLHGIAPETTPVPASASPSTTGTCTPDGCTP